jgi:hypothetical protein
MKRSTCQTAASPAYSPESQQAQAITRTRELGFVTSMALVNKEPRMKNQERFPSAISDRS